MTKAAKSRTNISETDAKILFLMSKWIASQRLPLARNILRDLHEFIYGEPTGQAGAALVSESVQ